MAVNVVAQKRKSTKHKNQMTTFSEFALRKICYGWNGLELLRKFCKLSLSFMHGILNK